MSDITAQCLKTLQRVAKGASDPLYPLEKVMNYIFRKENFKQLGTYDIIATYLNKKHQTPLKLS